MSKWLDFTAADVARVVVGPPLGPLAETLLALSAVRQSRAERGGRDAPRATASAERAAALASFLWLSPSVAFDLFSLVGPAADLRTGRDALFDAPGEVVAHEAQYWVDLRREARSRRLLLPTAPLEPPGLAGLRQGSRASRQLLLAALTTVYERNLEGRWDVIGQHLAAEHRRLTRQLAHAGVEGLFNALGPDSRWVDGALELARAGIGGCTTRHALGGRGLVVRPSYFGLQPQFYVPTDDTAPLLLIAPGPPGQATRPTSGGHRPPPPESLLGRTRTAALAVIADEPCSTSQLALRLNISISGASQHASVLRSAGLVATARVGTNVLHSVTDLGQELSERLRCGT